MERQFVVQRGPTRVVFGRSAAESLGGELDTLHLARAMVVATPGRRADAEALAARLGGRAVGVLPLAKEHVPREIVTEALHAVERAGADTLVAFGGGSTIGLAKAIARERAVRVVAVPTTYSGSEMTPIFGVTEAGEKKTGRDERVRPALVVYDPSLTDGLPRDVTLESLWNAMAHAAEALWSRLLDRATALAAEEALRLLAMSARRLAANGKDTEARDAALEGAYLAGASFGDAGSGLHHKTCHVLGGAFGMPHAATHAVLLPHMVAFHRESAPEAMRAIGRALGVMDPVVGFERLAAATGAPRALSKLGMPRDGIARVVSTLVDAPHAPSSPALDPAKLQSMLESAWKGPAERAPSPAVRAPESLGAGQPGLGSTHESEAPVHCRGSRTLRAIALTAYCPSS